MPFRFSTRPHKQFLWFLIRRDSRLSKSKQVGLDAGCADMSNRRFFQTDSYIGLDPDVELLKKGKSKYPEAKTINSKILDAPDISADFVQCIQVFVNADFNNKEAKETTKKLITMVRPGGVLLMNTGKQTICYDDDIRNMLEEYFDYVTLIKYGDWGMKNAPIIISLLIASVMYLVPWTRTFGGHAKSYFKCIGKI